MPLAARRLGGSTCERKVDLFQEVEQSKGQMIVCGGV
jgi:hypothetical protein